ncbi:MAG: hypothetical protein JW790_03130 [Dehalococcoidales bacterium]|nr:hypothetical protein [Dehalococcoidales bacterium]
MKFTIAAIKKPIDIKNRAGQQDVLRDVAHAKLPKKKPKPHMLRLREYVLDFAASLSFLTISRHLLWTLVFLGNEMAVASAIVAWFLKLERRVIKVARKSTSIVPRTP